MTVAGADATGEAPAPATSSSLRVPTRDELRARWTCDCELLQLVRPTRPGSHTAVAFMCRKREEAGKDTEGKRSQVTRILVPATPVTPSELGSKNMHKLWKLAASRDPRAHVTWALCLKLRQRPNPAWAVADEDQQRDTTIGKTILVPEPWESWGLRSDVMRGVWAGWSGDAPKPDVFKVRGVPGFIDYSTALRAVREMQ